MANPNKMGMTDGQLLKMRQRRAANRTPLPLDPKLEELMNAVRDGSKTPKQAAEETREHLKKKERN